MTFFFVRYALTLYWYLLPRAFFFKMIFLFFVNFTFVNAFSPSAFSKTSYPSAFFTGYHEITTRSSTPFARTPCGFPKRSFALTVSPQTSNIVIKNIIITGYFFTVHSLLLLALCNIKKNIHVMMLGLKGIFPNIITWIYFLSNMLFIFRYRSCRKSG